MKVLVLNPPTANRKYTREGRCQSEADTWLVNFPPSTLACIAGQVRVKHETKLIDCIGSNISFDSCIRMVQDFKPEYTVINTSTPTIENDISIAEEIKKTTGSKIIIYGEHATANHENVLKNDAIDYCIRGEPETPIMHILEGNVKNPGIAFNGFDGGIWQEPNLDYLDIPAYDLMPPYYYPLSGNQWMFVRSGRGCPFNCIYCIVPLMSGRKTRYHSPEYMIKQFEFLKKLNIKHWMLWDELATFDKQRMLNLCNLIKSGDFKDCIWFCTNRVDVFDEDLAKSMSEAGCRMMAFGLESGSNEVLKHIGKRITTDKSEEAIRLCKKHGIRTVAHFILGLPGSNKESDMETLDFAKRINPDFVQFYIATPFPGSQLYTLAKENNWLTTEDWAKVEQGDVTISYPDYSAGQIHEMRRKAYKEFYFRPRTIINGLTAISPKAWLKFPTYAKTFLNWMKR